MGSRPFRGLLMILSGLNLHISTAFVLHPSDKAVGSPETKGQTDIASQYLLPNL